MESKDINVWCRVIKCKHNESAKYATDGKGKFGWCILSQHNIDRDGRCVEIEEPNLDRGCDLQHERAERDLGAR